jgi:hypothetical protein
MASTINTETTEERIETRRSVRVVNTWLPVMDGRQAESIADADQVGIARADGSRVELPQAVREPRGLAGADWAPELRPTPDFVVFIAEHDEGFAPKVESIREHNPPEQVMRWEESWPPGAPRDDKWHEMPGAEATS